MEDITKYSLDVLMDDWPTYAKQVVTNQQLFDRVFNKFIGHNHTRSKLERLLYQKIKDNVPVSKNHKLAIITTDNASNTIDECKRLKLHYQITFRQFIVYMPTEWLWNKTAMNPDKYEQSNYLRNLYYDFRAVVFVACVVGSVFCLFFISFYKTRESDIANNKHTYAKVDAELKNHVKTLDELMYLTPKRNNEFVKELTDKFDTVYLSHSKLNEITDEFNKLYVTRDRFKELEKDLYTNYVPYTVYNKKVKELGQNIDNIIQNAKIWNMVIIIILAVCVGLFIKEINDNCRVYDEQLSNIRAKIENNYNALKQKILKRVKAD